MRLEGLEPPRANPPAPKADASTNSATAADSRDSRSPTIASAWGSGQIGKAPVSKTGDSRFESWLPRSPVSPLSGSTLGFSAGWAVLRFSVQDGPKQPKMAHTGP